MKAMVLAMMLAVMVSAPIGAQTPTVSDDAPHIHLNPIQIEVLPPLEKKPPSTIAKIRHAVATPFQKTWHGLVWVDERPTTRKVVQLVGDAGTIASAFFFGHNMLGSLHR